ncbi:hypothetical protein F4859DRAFT_323064 [Xylaria cf. heliscus]|nr:hypothetical protein F4859DRAFT_323064 [Xylaria cf. heliscus]
MPSYYYETSCGYDLAHQIRRDLRHSHRPTRYIINDGKLVVNERTYDDRYYYCSGSSSSSGKSDTVVYNSPGSTMYIDRLKDKRHHYSSCRERSYDGYSSESITVRLDRPRRHETITVTDRRRLEYPERRIIHWR